MVVLLGDAVGFLIELDIKACRYRRIRDSTHNRLATPF